MSERSYFFHWRVLKEACASQIYRPLNSSLTDLQSWNRCSRNWQEEKRVRVLQKNLDGFWLSLRGSSPLKLFSQHSLLYEHIPMQRHQRRNEITKRLRVQPCARRSGGPLSVDADMQIGDVVAALHDSSSASWRLNECQPDTDGNGGI